MIIPTFFQKPSQTRTEHFMKHNIIHNPNTFKRQLENHPQTKCIS